MFSKKERMSRDEFTRVFKKGKRVHSPLFQVITESTQTDVGNGKRAAVVSKKVARTAVGRNLLRRRIYAALKALSLKNTDCIVIAKKGAGDLTYKEIEAALKTLIGQGSVSR